MSTAAAAPIAVPGLRRNMVTICAMTATIMQALDTTIANVALPYMQGSLSASQDQINWVLTSYIVAAAIMTAPVGWIANRFGRKRIFIICSGGFTVASVTESGDKRTRFGPFSSQCRAGNVKILRGPWNENLFRVLEGFPDLAHDDEVDACSGALEMLNPQMKGAAIFELYRRQAEQLQAEQRGKPQPTQTVHAPGSREWFAAQNKSS